MSFDFTSSSRSMSIGRALICLIAIAALLAGCEKKAGEDASAAKAAAKAAPAVDTAGATEADCEAYGKALCAMAGDTSATCTSIKEVLGLLTPAACKAGLTDTDYSKTRLAALTKVCDELIAKLCGDLGAETKTCAMVKEKTPQFGAEKCKQMMSDYPKIIAQLKQMEDANKPLSPEKIAKMNAPGGTEHGAKDAKVTVVEFSDFQCPYCSRAATAANAIKEKYGDKVRVIFRHFPLSFHKDAHLASQASMAANEQGKFWEFHDLLFANQKAMGRADLEKYAGQLKLDMGKFKKALDEGTYKAAVDADMELGKSVGVQGTPTMFINGSRAANAGDADALSKEIDPLLAAK